MGMDSWIVRVSSSVAVEDLSSQDLDSNRVKTLGQFRSFYDLNEFFVRHCKQAGLPPPRNEAFFEITEELLTKLEIAQKEGMGSGHRSEYFEDSLVKCRVALHKGFKLAYYLSH